MATAHPVTRARGVLAGAAYETKITAGRHALSSDEPQGAGGADAGPGPFALVLSGLIACTAITLRMYAERKGLTLRSVTVDAAYHHEGEDSHVDRVITLDGDLDDAVRARMGEIADRTPVTLALKAGMNIKTRIAAPA